MQFIVIINFSICNSGNRRDRGPKVGRSALGHDARPCGRTKNWKLL